MKGKYKGCDITVIKENPMFGEFGQIENEGVFLTKEGAQFLVWQKKYPPHMIPPISSTITNINIIFPAFFIIKFLLFNFCFCF